MTIEESKILRFLYTTFIGRCILKILTCRFISKICGFFLDTRLSKSLIKPFVKKNNINLNDYYSDNFKSFNDFFSRKIKDGKRSIIKDKKRLISPADGLISAYKITDDLILNIKNSKYSIASLLKNEKLAMKYKNGTAVVIRLCVDNYHRYCYPDSGIKGDNIYIKGILHTVRPIALEHRNVFIENSREYTVLKTNNFGDIVMMEVGALLVGKIKNYHQEYRYIKGEEKGTFLYGGSTIILLIENEKVKIKKDYFKETNKGREIPIKMGEVLGEKK